MLFGQDVQLTMGWPQVAMTLGTSVMSAIGAAVPAYMTFRMNLEKLKSSLAEQVTTLTGKLKTCEDHHSESEKDRGRLRTRIETLEKMLDVKFEKHDSKDHTSIPE